MGNGFLHGGGPVAATIVCCKLLGTLFPARIHANYFVFTAITLQRVGIKPANKTGA